MPQQLRGQGGFTLIELIVVMVILLLLAALVMPRLVGRAEQGRRAASIAQLTIIEGELEKYMIDNGKFPTTQEGLEALVREPPGARNWRGPYLKDAILPKDSWGYDYQYKSPGDENRDYDLWSTGADGELGGEGENADIKSWDPESKKG
jgi:general secretion pathway protein G